MPFFHSTRNFQTYLGLLKCFGNKHEWIFFHNSRIMESVTLIHAKYTGFGGGPTWVTLWLIDWLLALIIIRDWFTLLFDILAIIPKLCTIAHGGSLPRYVLIFPLIVVYACLDSYVCMIIQDIHWFTRKLPRQLHFISRDPTLGT